MTLNILLLIPLISVILYVFILVIIITSNQTRLSKAFNYYIVAMIIWSLGSFLMKTGIAPGPLFFNKFILQPAFIFVPVFLLQFSYVLINKTGKKTFLKWAYLFGFFLIILSFTGLVVEDAWVLDGDFDYRLGYGAYLVAAVSLIVSIVAFVTMIKAVQKDQVNMKKVQLVIFGVGMVVVGGALNIFPFLGKYAIDIIFNGISAILITYSIYRNKFLELNLVVKRGLYFSLYNILLYVVYATFIIFTYELIHTNFDQEIFVTVLIMSPLFLLLEPIRRMLEKVSQNIFYRASTDRQIILNEFSSIISSSFSLEKITESLMFAIKQGMECKDVSILLKNTNKYILHDTTILEINYKGSSILFGHPVLTWFNEGKEILLKTEVDNHILFKKLWDSEKRVIQNMNTELIAPVKYLDDIIGLVVISERIDETPYTEQEVQFLKTILNNGSAIIENAKQLDNLKRQSITDELTKLSNHRYFYEQVTSYLKEESLETAGIAIVDIDQFKIYNDLYGHSAGDKALKRIASIIEEHTPKEALISRYGGEEFGIYYPNYDRSQMLSSIEDIRKAVENKFLLSTEIKEFLTVSVGAALYQEHGNNLEDIVKKAFDAVLHCKQSGRNKSIVYSEDEERKDNVQKDVQDKIKEAYLSSTYALAATIDAKDHYTFGHSNNVAELSVALAKEIEVIEKDIDTIRNAGLLHDIGKVGIPESVLLKRGYLTDQEMEIMRSHVVQSINIIKHIPNLVDTIPIIISHHERFDGGGYPRGISGDNIPLLGRVICIADSFDAMTTDRPYRKGLSLDQALFELKKNSGSQFDPILVGKFIDMVNNGKLDSLTLENRLSF